MTNTLPNYVVTTSSWKGRFVTECDTSREVWDAIGSMSFGGIYRVDSPKGLDLAEFIAF
jgi:hypothetical protein